MECAVEGGVSANGGALRVDVLAKGLIPHGDFTKDMSVDVTVYHPQCRADMARKERAKDAKYKDQVEQRGTAVFLPVAITTFGGLGPSARKAIYNIAAAQVRVPSATIDEPTTSLYDKATIPVHLSCLQRISVALQTGVIQSIRRAARHLQGLHSRHAGQVGRPARMRAYEPWKLVEFCRRSDTACARTSALLNECAGKPGIPLLAGDSQKRGDALN
jgi:hypothetical protein